MRLSVRTPFTTVVQTEEAIHIRAEDDSGAFGLLDGHADFLTALTASVLIWRDRAAKEHYVALRGGMLALHRGHVVTVATSEAVTGTDLRWLEAEVLGQFRRHIEEERAAHSDAQRLQLAAMRQIIRLLRSERGWNAVPSPSIGSRAGLES